MRPKSLAFIGDAQRAAGLIQQSVTGHVLADYLRDPLLKSAAERQFEIIGEALNGLSHTDPDVAVGVPHLPRIVAFRNVLTHGYAVIDDEIVGEAATTKVSGLVETLDGLLNDVAGSGHG